MGVTIGVVVGVGSRGVEVAVTGAVVGVLEARSGMGVAISHPERIRQYNIILVRLMHECAEAMCVEEVFNKS